MKCLILGLCLAVMPRPERFAAQPAPQIFEEFNGWTGVNSPDGVWRRNGDWTATGGCLFKLSNAIVSTTYNGQPGGYLDLVVRANQLEGGEIQTIGTTGSNFGYGYYEVRMQPGVPMCCVSFFWIQEGYGPGEIDIEFLTNEVGSRSGKVHYSVHPNGGPSYIQSFSFGAYREFHRYGFLWKADRITYTIDGHVTHTWSSPTTPIPSGHGYIMMNAWTGTPGWGEGPPPVDVHSYYDWVKFWPNLAEVPGDSSVTGITLGPVVPAGTILNRGVVRDVSELRFDPPQGQAVLYDLTGRIAAEYMVADGRLTGTGSTRLPDGTYLVAREPGGEVQRVVLVK